MGAQDLVMELKGDVKNMSKELAALREEDKNTKSTQKNGANSVSKENIECHELRKKIQSLMDTNKELVAFNKELERKSDEAAEVSASVEELKRKHEEIMEANEVISSDLMEKVKA